MPFRRRIPKPTVAKMKDVLWPTMGMSRLASYYKRRVVRLNGTPHSIAAGFAAGAAVSFTPFMGLHFLLGALIAYLLRGNLIASAIGTAIGNPWTFPFIWLAIYEVGIWILPMDTHAVAWEEMSLTYLSEHLSDVLVPMMLGGFIVSLVVWPLFYFPLVNLISRFRHARQERRKRKMLARQAARETVEQSVS